MEQVKLDGFSFPDCISCNGPSQHFCSSCFKYLCDDCWDFLHNKIPHTKVNGEELKNLEHNSKYSVGDTVTLQAKKKTEMLKNLKAEAEKNLKTWKNNLDVSYIGKLKEIVKGCNDDLEKSQMLIIGRTSSGKTTFINWLLGEKVGIIKTGKSTSFISNYLPVVENGEFVEEMFSGDKCVKSFRSETPSLSENERKEYIEKYLENPSLDRVDYSNIYVKSDLLKYVKIIDSPGLGKEKVETNDKNTLEIAEKASIVVYIIGDVTEELDFQNIEKLIPHMINNQLIILVNKVDVPIEIDQSTYEKEHKKRIDEISSRFSQFKDSQFQESIFVISIKKLNRPWENKNKIYEKIGSEFKNVIVSSFNF
jgi:predicted GTPase